MACASEREGEGGGPGLGSSLESSGRRARVLWQRSIRKPGYLGSDYFILLSPPRIQGRAGRGAPEGGSHQPESQPGVSCLPTK